MTGLIEINCKISTATTNWASGDIRIVFVTPLGEAEIEREELGDLARDKMPCTVRIHEHRGSDDKPLELACRIQSVTTDHKAQHVTVSIAASVTEENVQKVRSLAVLAVRETLITAIFEPRQMKMDIRGKLQDADLEMRTAEKEG